MSDHPVLDIARELLKFKGSTTITEIARIGDMKPLRVLQVMNKNKAHTKVASNGKILSVHPEKTKRGQLLLAVDRYYSIQSYGAWAHEGDQIVFEGRDELRNSLKRPHTTGGLGDSYTIEIIEATADNVHAVRKAGLVEWKELEREIDDSLWEE